MKALLPAAARRLLEPHLPDDLEVVWFAEGAAARAAIADVEIAWADLHDKAEMRAVFGAAGAGLRWVSTIYAGLDAFPLEMFRDRDVTLTNGTGINAVAVAEYAVMGVLACAKRLDMVVRAYDRAEWLDTPPGRVELDGTAALVIGYGTIGRMIGDRLAAFGVAVTGVTRSGRDDTLMPDAWRDRLGDFDWVILAAPSTGDTKAMIGTDELRAMRPGAWLVNIARGDMIDDDALVAALKAERIAGAFLDPTEPEPLPPGHALWGTPNTIVTMHLSGKSQTTMFQRGAALFLKNLAAYRAGDAMTNVADLDAGY